LADGVYKSANAAYNANGWSVSPLGLSAPMTAPSLYPVKQ